MKNGAGDTKRQERAQAMVGALLRIQQEELWEGETMWCTLRWLASAARIRPTAYAQSIAFDLVKAGLLMRRKGFNQAGAMRWEYALLQKRVVEMGYANG